MQHTNLIDVLKERSSLHRAGITFIEGGDREDFLSYNALYQSALMALAYLQNKGMVPGDELVFQIEDNKTFIKIFWACVLGGIIPVPLALGKNEAHKQKLFTVWPLLNDPRLVISRSNFNRMADFAAEKGYKVIYDQMEGRVIEDESVLACQEQGIIHHARSEDTAFIQFSSGSTGTPKGVTLSHINLITNISDIAKAAGYGEKESMFSWMPLIHDMGLIGFHINPLFCGMHHYLMPASLFVRRPSLWLDKVTEHAINILCSPNFGYAYLLRHCDNAAGAYTWRLNCVRVLFNGAEPVSEKLCNDFLGWMAQYGLKSKAMCPVYGLAEASLAVSISGTEDEIRSVSVNRNKVSLGDKVTPATGDDAITFVNVGPAIENCSLRITDDFFSTVPDETIGHIQIKGNNVTKGYYNNKRETKKTITNDEWLQTGDLGFIKNGSLYITGRSKDIIFINGQNYYPHDIEQVAEELECIELNKIAAAGWYNKETNKEEIIIFVLHRGDVDMFITLAKKLKSHLGSKIGIDIDRVIPVPDIPRTTSGKLQRFRLMEQFKEGKFALVEQQMRQLADSASPEPLVLPVTDDEQIILALWKRILKTDAVNVDQSFFEAGGNSLKVAELAMLLFKELGIELPLERIYEKPTVKELAALIGSAARQSYTPIAATNKLAHCAVSAAQERLYYLQETNRSSIAYNIPVAFQWQGAVNSSRLEHCIQQIINRHELLRASFIYHERPVLQFRDELPFALPCTECTPGETDQVLRQLVRPFDLAEGPLFRIELLKQHSDKYILLLDFHHIISDGISIYHFMEEMLELYTGKELPVLPLQYRDYILWEKDHLSSATIQGQQAYWLSHLNNDLPLLEMPLDKERPPVFDTRGAKLAFELNDKTTAQLRKLAMENNCTLHVLLFTIYNILLLKYTAQEDLVIGIPVSGRLHPDLLTMQGMFVNNLAIRTKINARDPFSRLLQQCKHTMAQALNNQDYPFDQLIQQLGARRNASRNPLFDTMFVYQNMGMPVVKDEAFSLNRYFFDPGFTKFDLSLEVFEEGASVSYYFEYALSLFKKETILMLANCFETLIRSIVDNPQSSICDLSVISSARYELNVRTFNDTHTSYPAHKTMHRLFEEQVELCSKDVAIVFGNEQLTYEELNYSADCLAGRLRKKGVFPNIIVGVLLPRTPEFIIAILAILKAGGCYVPIDINLPEERIKYLVKDSKCKIVITGEETVPPTDLLSSIEILKINRSELQQLACYNIEDVSNSRNLAYVIYTSGTTGKPKGVMIEHRSLVNYIVWAADKYVRNGQLNFPLFTSVSFDLTVTSIFTPLLTGNKIIIYPEHEKETLLEKVISDNSVDIIKLTPAHLKLLINNRSIIPAKSRVKRLIVGGEKLETRVAAFITDAFGKDIEIYNEYGPTEATVGCMIYKYKKEDNSVSVPIGIPAANSQIYILDKFLHPVPEGVHGELYISGDGLARGYLFNDALTRERFISNPFKEGEKMYKTGDMARRNNDGVIEYIGRQDQQVKISGYRIEPGEIEHHILQFEGIKNALVTVKEGAGGQKNIYAYYCAEPATTKENKVMDPAALRNYLAIHLPYYMIPVQFIKIDELPLTQNGKIDYQALPDVNTHGGRPEKISPRNETETALLEIWQEILGVEEAGVTDNFFECGGDSIKAFQIASRLTAKGIVVHAKDILTYHSPEQIAAHAVINIIKAEYRQDPVHGEKDFTPIEQWFFENRFANPAFYNQSLVLRFKKKIQVNLLEDALVILIKHHDGLRLNYDIENNTLFYNDKYLYDEFSIPVFETSNGKDAGGAFITICQQIKKSLEISGSRLIKLAVIRGYEVCDLLFITAHHLIIDGVSWRILLEDLFAVYNALVENEVINLPAKTASLIDWNEALVKYTQSGILHRFEEYWNKIQETAFAIPLDVETPDWRYRHANTISGSLDKERTRFLLTEAHQIYLSDVPVLLNTALALTVKEWTGKNIMVIEQEHHGRNLDLIDVSRTIGWFTTMYPLILELKEYTMGNQIKAIKEKIRNVPDHGMSFRRKYNGRKMAEIRFNYLGRFDKEFSNEVFEYADMSTGSDVDPENEMTARLELNSMVIDGEFKLQITYNTTAHTAASVNWFRDQFFKNLLAILDHIAGEQEIHFTPSDFKLAALDQEELDALFR